MPIGSEKSPKLCPAVLPLTSRMSPDALLVKIPTLMKTRSVLIMLLLASSLSGICFAAELACPLNPNCDDPITAVAIVEPTLDSAFFRSKEGSYPFHIIEHDDGHLENTLGGKVRAEDAVKIQHTAKCVSSHQGEHLMSFCSAESFEGGLLLKVTGGLPAYASSLTVRIGKDKDLKCGFVATYPMRIPGEKLTWKITRKTFKMTSDHFKAGVRLLGWLSVEFEETCTIGDKTTSRSHKIEGYVKPEIRKAAPNPKPIYQ